MPRPSKYDSHVKPRFADIKKWLANGATKKEIAKSLGIHECTLIEYDKKFTEFSELLKDNRKEPVEDIKAAMLKRSLGFQYEEKKVITQRIKLDDGKETPATLVRTEVTTKFALPSETAGLILLQHWDLDENGNTKWSRDVANREIKKRELKIREEEAKNKNW